MPYDDKLASRIRAVLVRRAGVTEKAMFGGLAYLLDGKMFCGIANDDLMVRVGPDAYEAALARAHARPMDFTGRPMMGYVFVGPRGTRTAAAVARWTDEALAYVATVPAKKKRAKRRPPRQRVTQRRARR